MRRVLLSVLLLALSLPLAAQELRLPNRQGTIKFAVIGDSGTGGSDQLNVAKQLAVFRGKYPFEFAIMLGDNLYGSERPADYVRKFERPYKPLLDAGVTFYAALGNHDDPNQRLYKPFNMSGEASTRSSRRRRATSGSSRSTATTWIRSSSSGSTKNLRPAARSGRSRSSPAVFLGRQTRL